MSSRSEPAVVLAWLAVVASGAIVAPPRALAGDPGIVYSSLLGGAGSDIGYSIATDGRGGVYVAGETDSLNFPSAFAVVVKPAGTSAQGGLVAAHTDVFVAKFDLAPDHVPALVWSTRVGGSDDDRATGIAVDTTGSVYVTGLTYSSDFPVTANAFAGSRGGPYDAFVFKLSPDGSGLEYGTYLGGSGGDYALSIAVSGTQEAYITGGTESADFPVTPGAFATSFAGDVDLFVARLDASGSRLEYSTYVGGVAYDDGASVCVNRSGEAYVTGRSGSPDFPITPGAFQSAWQGSFDTVVFKLSADGTSLLYSTFVSAPRRDEGHAIAIDELGNAYVAGVARGELFPVTPGAFDTTHNGGYDVTVFKLDPHGSRLEYSTFLGGSLHDIGWDIAVDARGHAFVTGMCYSPEFPVTVGATSTEFNGYCDAFVTELNATGSALVYSTFLGRHKLDEGVSLALSEPAGDGSQVARAGASDRGGGGEMLFLTGCTYSTFFPTTADAYDSTWNGNFDTFVTELDLRSSCPAEAEVYGEGWPGTGGFIPSLTAPQPPALCAPFTVELADAFAPSQGAIIVGLAATDVPTSLGGSLLVTPGWVLSLAVSTSLVSLPIEVCDQSLCGLQVYLQAMILDPGASQSVSFTNGLRLALGSG